MQEEEDYPPAIPAIGRVNDIRRQWAVHEDEAFAYKLQNEEITQHYTGNKTRNAIVREDAPLARESQRQEEQEALEQRFRHLNLLQRQAEQDERLAQVLSQRYQRGSFDDGTLFRPAKESVSEIINPGALRTNEYDSAEELTASAMGFSTERSDSPLLGAASLKELSPLAAAIAGPSKSSSYDSEEGLCLEEDDFRRIQEEKDAALAKRLQEELEQLERDRRLAIEAQDRELAKMLHDKEKAKLKRAKERAKMKAEAAASGTVGGLECDGQNVPQSSPEPFNETRNMSRTSVSPVVRQYASSSRDPLSPPRIPGKSRSNYDRDDPIGFRANPKPLPPQPQQSTFQLQPLSSTNRSEYEHVPEDPVPPYMPIQGFNRSKKRNK